MKYEAHYAASEGGKIEGETEQYRKAGDAYEAVTAVSYPGYRFIGWSDGVTEPTRQDVSTEEGVDCEALFEEIKIHFYRGGELQTSISFSELAEIDITELFPPKEDYCVWNWTVENIEDFPFLSKENADDDFEKIVALYTGAVFKDIADVELVGASEPFSVKCYSDGLLVRSIPLKELAQMDEAQMDELIGYRTGKTFVGWSFSEDVLQQYPECASVEKPLQYLAEMVTDGELPFKKHVTLVANYEDGPFVSPAQSSITIAHGMGKASTLNTLEGFIDHYSRGQRFFEADISLTSDGKSVLFHIQYVRGDGDRPVPLEDTREEFSKRSEKGCTYIDLEQLIQLMQTFPDIVIDFDILSVYNGYLAATEKYDGVTVFLQKLASLVGEETALYDRMVMELMPPEMERMIADCKAIGMKHFLLPCDAYYHNDGLVDDPEALAAYCTWARDNGVAFMSFSAIGTEAIRIVKSYGIRIAVYTFDDPIEMYEWYDLGVDFIFCNVTVM